MSASYKIALGLAAALVVIVIIYFAGQGGENPADTQTVDAGTGDAVAAGTGDDDNSTLMRTQDPAGDAAARTGTGTSSDNTGTAGGTSASGTGAAGSTGSGTAADAGASDTGANTDLMARIRQQIDESGAGDATGGSDIASGTGDPVAGSQGDSATAADADPDAGSTDSTGTTTLAGTDDDTDTDAGTSAADDTGSVATGTAGSTATDPDTTGSTGDVTGSTGTTGSTGSASADTGTGTGATAGGSTESRSAGGTYVVEAGDNFFRISEKVFGSDRYWQEIGQANPFVDPNRLKIGQELRMPSQADIDRIARAAAGDTGAADTPGGPNTVVHTVKAGETLSGIAGRYYTDETKWRQIYSANRDTIGPSPDRLKVGMKLAIPPAEAE